MSKLVIVVEVDDGIMPSLVDPHEVAEDIVDEYNAACSANGWHSVEFVSAEWSNA
jgi:hypothetical protein